MKTSDKPINDLLKEPVLYNFFTVAIKTAELKSTY